MLFLQVGSVKSIQVQSKKTALRITTHSSKVTPTVTSNAHLSAADIVGSPSSIHTVAVGDGSDEVYEIPASYTGNSDDVFVASLTRRGDSGLGLGLIDGMVCGILILNYLLVGKTLLILIIGEQNELSLPWCSR